MAQDGFDPIASGLPRIAIRGRPFLSERSNDNWFRYYKDGLSRRRNPSNIAPAVMGFAALNPSYACFGKWLRGLCGLG